VREGGLNRVREGGPKRVREGGLNRVTRRRAVVTANTD
jgi:hypothetical protein